MNTSTQAVGRRFDLGNLGLAAFVALLIVGFSLASPHFLTFGNITNMLLAVSVIGVMAAVSTLVIVGRELDLSVGSVAALVGVVVAILVESKGWAWPAGLAAGIAVGALTGAFNGFMVASLRVNSIITTIGTLALFRGIAFIVTDGQTAMVQNEPILAFGFGRILGVPSSPSAPPSDARSSRSARARARRCSPVSTSPACASGCSWRAASRPPSPACC